MQNTSAKGACEQLPTQKTYAPQKNSKPLFFFSDQLRKIDHHSFYMAKKDFTPQICLQIKE
jgi:hypothetical protein